MPSRYGWKREVIYDGTPKPLIGWVYLENTDISITGNSGCGGWSIHGTPDPHAHFYLKQAMVCAEGGNCVDPI